MYRLLALALVAAAAAVAAGDAQPPATTASPSPDLFETRVRPTLARTCTPCHAPGGVMYDRLPFDKADVVASKKEGVLRRLKGDDKQLVEEWFASRK